MKKLKQNLILASVLFISFLFVNCEKDNISLKEQKLEIIDFKQNSSTNISFSENGLTINFKSTLNDNKVLSEVSIIDDNLNKELLTNSFLLNKNLPSYKLGLFNDIESISNKLMNELNADDWNKARNIYESFLKNLSKNIDIEKYQSELVQATFYHLSIFNTITRSLNSKEDCECTPLPAYYVGKSPFWCQEDYLFEVKNMLDYYNKNKELLFSYDGGEKEYNYVKNLDDKKQFITYKELFKLHYSVKSYKEKSQIKFKKAQKNSISQRNEVDREDCWSGGLGSDLGCCGNYSGCCWYASLACLRHDIACLNCDKWHCGPACTPN